MDQAQAKTSGQETGIQHLKHLTSKLSSLTLVHPGQLIAVRISATHAGHFFSPGTGETEAGRSLHSRLACLVYGASSRGTQRNPVSSKIKANKQITRKQHEDESLQHSEQDSVQNSASRRAGGREGLAG